MTSVPLPINQLNQDLVFKAEKPRWSYHFARVFYVALALVILVTAMLIAVPNYQVPRSKAYLKARSFLEKNRVLKSHLGTPLKISNSPDSYEREGSKWRFLIAVHGLNRSDTVLVTVEERAEVLTVLEARFQSWNLVTGSTILKDRKKPR